MNPSSPASAMIPCAGLSRIARVATNPLTAPLRGVLALLLFTCTLTLAPAQEVATGRVSGRVYDPATGEYLRNARVQIAETGAVTTSGDGGEYTFDRVPAGEASVSVMYTGFQVASATVTVTPGGAVEQDFNLHSSAAPAEAIKLEKLVVVADRSGNAKAIMDQRSSMNITNTVASDVFGNNAEGNIGEFLKMLPGVELDLQFGEVRNVRLRGLPSEYTAVTVDGVSLATADPGQGLNRSFSFEQISLSSMDSIEVFKTISADVDANAPAGTINLRTKRAFDRSGRRITWQANATAYSDEFTLSKGYGPSEDKTYKVRPGGIFEFSDQFFNKRLGVVLNISESNVYAETQRTSLTFNRATTSTDTRPEVITEFAHTDAPRTKRRSSTTLTTDFKATDKLVLSMTAIYNYVDLWNPQKVVTVRTGTRAVVGTDPLTSFTSGTTGNLVSTPTNISKQGITYTLLPKAELKLGALTLNANFAYTSAVGWYDPLGHRGSIRGTGAQNRTGVGWSASRPDAMSPEWTVTQVVGPDISDGAGYTSPTITVDDGRYQRDQIFVADLSATLKTVRFLPIEWKAGIKRKMEWRNFRDDTTLMKYDYIGPGAATTGLWRGIYQSPVRYDFGDMYDSTLTSITGGSVYTANLLEIANLYKTNPEYFRSNLTTTDYYTANVVARRKYEEQIDAAYLMATSRLKRMTLRAGLRWEETSTETPAWNPYTAAQVRAAGFPTDNGLATTIPGINYQFLSRPRVPLRHSYDNFFPSASAKFPLRSNLDLQLGYSSTIRRPAYGNIIGVFAADDETLRVTAPNRELKPETSDNYSVRLAYYFEPVGVFSLDFFQNNVQNLQVAQELTAAEFGYNGTPPGLENYTFVTTSNRGEETTFRGMELEYRQSLSFLRNPVLRGLGINASYTRRYADVLKPMMAPHSTSAGINYAYGRVSGNVNMVWTDSTIWNAADTQVRRHRLTADIGLNLKLSKRTRFFLTAQNVANTPVIFMTKVPPNPPTWFQYEKYGTQWTFGLAGTF